MTNGINIELLNLTKSFGKKEVLKDINLTIPAGQFVAIIGKSGCGKSTLLRIIANLEKKSSGESLKNGIEQQDFSDVRVMFQEDRLLPWLSVVENVGIGSKLENEWKPLALQALEQVGLHDRANEWPHVLSGGQKQRVALARALSAKPKLLLLDEPLGALDALTRLEMQQLIEELWLSQKYTSLLVTHDVTEAITLADRIILIEDGKVALDIPVQLPRPRNRSNPKFTEIEEFLLHNLLGKKRTQPKESTPLEVII